MPNPPGPPLAPQDGAEQERPISRGHERTLLRARLRELEPRFSLKKVGWNILKWSALLIGAASLAAAGGRAIGGDFNTVFPENWAKTFNQMGDGTRDFAVNTARGVGNMWNWSTERIGATWNNLFGSVPPGSPKPPPGPGETPGSVRPPPPPASPRL